MNDITKTDRFKVMLREAEAFVCSPRTYATDEDKHIAQFVAKFALNILDLKEQLLAKAASEGIPQLWVDVKCSNCGKMVTVGNDADTPLPT